MARDRRARRDLVHGHEPAHRGHYAGVLVAAAHGYPAGAEPGRCWALRATLTRSEAAWAELLTSLPGQPTMVVCDEDDSIIRAVGAVWPGTFIKRCEHHLREGVKKRMATYGKTTFGHPAMKLLNDAFHSS